MAGEFTFVMAVTTLGASANVPTYFPYGVADDTTRAVVIVHNIPQVISKFFTTAMLNGFTVTAADMGDVKQGVRTQYPDSIFVEVTRPKA